MNVLERTVEARERERIDHKSRIGIVRIEERERGSERGLVH